MSRDLKERVYRALQLSRGREFQAEDMARAKALRQELALLNARKSQWASVAGGQGSGAGAEAEFREQERSQSCGTRDWGQGLGGAVSREGT